MIYSTIYKNAKDIDEKKGIVAFYFADFNSVDAHGRRMSKNAFNRTFKNNKDRIAHLFNHDPNTIVGKPIELGTDEKGAFMVSQLSKSTKGLEVLTLYSEGILNEHSFGFEILDSYNDEKIEVVKEVRMWEGSTVTWGANQNTPTIALNSNQNKQFETIINKLDKLATLFNPEGYQAQQLEESANEITATLKYLNDNF